MKVLIIYDSETRDVVERIRGTIAERFGKYKSTRNSMFHLPTVKKIFH
jgi:hypothetical protein